MKNLKKVLALLVATLILVASMSIAFAAAPTTGTITITSSKDNTVTSGRKFKAYRILDATETFTHNDADGYTASGYAYTIPNANIQSALATHFNLTQGTKTVEAFDKEIIDAIGAVSGASNIEAMAKALLTIAKTNGAASVDLDIGTASGQIPFGYYVIEDVTSPEETNVSAVMLDTNNPNVTINVKASKPTLDKKIDEGSTTGRYDATDVKYDNHAVGDTVPYVLKSNIPEMTGFTKYYYIVNDTMSKGLAYQNDVVVKRIKTVQEDNPATTDVTETSYEQVTTLTAGTDYTVTPTTVSDGTAATAIKIVFNDFYNKEKDHAGEILEITYSAIVTKDAVIGVEGNPNTATLTYSNNPNDDYSHETDTDEPIDTSLTSTTPVSETRTYVTGLKVVKVDPNGNRLPGATFELSGSDLNKVEVVTADKFEEANDGTFYLLNDGTYTTTAPTALDSEAANYQTLLDKYVDKTGNTKYKKTTVTYTEKTASGSPLKVSETTIANGVIIFDGLEDGTYTLTETAAPTGYNKLQTPIDFTINWTQPAANATNENCSWTVTDVTSGYTVTYDEIANEFNICIENQNGTELPATGGIGTTIFYIAGSVLVLAAVVLLITKRRMGAND